MRIITPMYIKACFHVHALYHDK